MRNKIYHITKNEAKEYIKQAEQAESRIVGIDLKGMKSWSEYSYAMEKVLEFPRPVAGMPARFLDWIRDLNWFDNKRYDIFLYNFGKFAAKHFEDAYNIYDEYKRFVLPFWEYEAPNCIVGGETKEFYVYIVR